jgi:hypothetical protein
MTPEELEGGAGLGCGGFHGRSSEFDIITVKVNFAIDSWV